MFTVRIYGGLGNQMFQYAFLKMLRKHFSKEEIYYENYLYYFYNAHNGFELDSYFEIDEVKLGNSKFKRMFPVTHFLCSHKKGRKSNKLVAKLMPMAMVIDKQLRKKSLQFKEDIATYCYDDSIFRCKSDKDTYFFGYWQNIRYYEGGEEYLQKVFDFSNKLVISEESEMLLKEITKAESISIHVRRGDYSNNNQYDLCHEEYYQAALNEMLKKLGRASKNIKLFFFTDDVEFVMEHYKGYEKTVVCHKNNSGLDMFLMSQCKHNIIANSSYSFWGAFLNSNQEKVVIAPKYVYRNNDKLEQFCYPKSWIIVNNVIE